MTPCTPDTPTPNYEKLLLIHNWASKFTADYHGTDKFIETDTYRLLLHILKNQKGNVIVVTGVQGVGKTETRVQLTSALDHSNVISVNWESGEQIRDLINQFRKKTEYIEEESKILGKEGIKEIKLVVYYDKDPDAILIDFKDYHMTYRSRAISDLIELQGICEMLSHPVKYRQLERIPFYQNMRTNVVVFYQRELWNTIKHFWTGKPKVFEIDPLDPADLVEHYHEFFGYTHQFTPEALRAIAEMSRGVFRWFMKYISLCLDNQILKIMKKEEIQTLTLDDVHAIIKPSQIIREWENEFKVLFPRSEDLRLTAELIMRYLKKNEKAAQKSITEKFFDLGNKGEVACSRMVIKLEDAGYIKRILVGREKYIELV